MKKALASSLLFSLLLSSTPVQASPFEPVSLRLSQGLSPSLGEHVYAPGTDGVAALGLHLGCSKHSECIVSSLTFQGFVDENGTHPGLPAFNEGSSNGVSVADLITDAYLVNNADGSVVAGPVVPASDGTLFFTDEFTLEASQSMDLTLYMDFTDSGNFNGTPESIAFVIWGSSDVEAEDETGSSIAVAGSSNSRYRTYLTVQE
jgi:hypothetical protein